MKTVTFVSTGDGRVKTKWEGKTAYPAKGGSQPEAGETWEVISARLNPAGTVYFLTLGNKIDMVLRTTVALPDGQEMPVQLSIEESWQTRDGLRMRGMVTWPEKTWHKSYPSLSVKTAASLEIPVSHWHQASVKVDTPLGEWGYNLEMQQGERRFAGLFFSSLGDDAPLAVFEVDFATQTWQRIK